MINKALLSQWWGLIKNMNTPTLGMNASALCQLHGCERTLGLQPLPDLQFPDLPSIGLFSRKPAFKNLDFPGILTLRKYLHTTENTRELSHWAETLLRYLEINLSSLLKRARSQYGSAQAGRQALLELTAFMLDVYFEWLDLRFLNIALKLMDIPGILTVKSISKDLTDQDKKLPAALVQVRLLIMSEAALQGLSNTLAS
jgi:hypothetical protein